METKKKSNKYTDTLILAAGESIVAVLIIAAYALLGRFEWTVVTGVLLGGAITVINFLMLTVSVDRAIEKYMDTRGDKEMSEEEAAAFSNAHSMEVQNAVTKSYIFRTAFMLVAFVLALITGYFNPLATLIPPLMYKPLIYVSELIRKKRGE